MFGVIEKQCCNYIVRPPERAQRSFEEFKKSSKMFFKCFCKINADQYTITASLNSQILMHKKISIGWALV